VPRQKIRLRLLQPMLFEPFDVSRILETWKFPVRFLHGERLERLERSACPEQREASRRKAVERLERLELAFSFCESDLFTSKKRALASRPRYLYNLLALNQWVALVRPGAGG